jgi:hypothetical protein
MSSVLYVSPESAASHPENDEDISLELRKREMAKMYEAKIKMRKVYNDIGGGGGGGATSDTFDFDITDMTEKDVAIVCEELWLDFSMWMNTQNNARDCAEKVYLYLSRNWEELLYIALSMIVFRWYVGAGKDACAYGFGWGAVSLICEVMRHIGEIILAILMILCGLCCGMLPVITFACIYEGLKGDTYGDDDDGAVGDGDDDAGLDYKEKND